jgi:hypothetical protein
LLASPITLSNAAKRKWTLRGSRIASTLRYDHVWLCRDASHGWRRWTKLPVHLQTENASEKVKQRSFAVKRFWPSRIQILTFWGTTTTVLVLLGRFLVDLF